MGRFFVKRLVTDRNVDAFLSVVLADRAAGWWVEAGDGALSLFGKVWRLTVRHAPQQIDHLGVGRVF